MSTLAENRKLNGGLVFLTGLLLGVGCYLLAEVLIPEQVANSGDHDILLADWLGFIYTPVVGLWLGWLQRSRRRALCGAGVGIAIGFAYMALCASRNFLAIMVGFPCLLGGVVAGVVGSNRSPWLFGLGGRLGKGLLAGLVLGFVYMVVLNIAGGMVMTAHDNYSDETRGYVAMMWRAGPVALGLSSGLFFVLIRWAVGLTRVRILVFDDVPRPGVEPAAAPNGGPTASVGDSDVSGGPPSVS
jgi:hypothetical protein